MVYGRRPGSAVLHSGGAVCGEIGIPEWRAGVGPGGSYRIRLLAAFLSELHEGLCQILAHPNGTAADRTVFGAGGLVRVSGGGGGDGEYLDGVAGGRVDGVFARVHVSGHEREQ